MDTGSVLGIVGIVIATATAIIGAINHSRIRSSCMGRDLEVSLDIEKTTPKEKTIPILENQ